MRGWSKEKGKRSVEEEDGGMVAVRAGSTKFTIHIATARIFKPLIKGATRMGWRTGYSQM